MTPYKAIMTLRSMSQDGVNHVGEIADVIESMQNRLDAYEQGVQADIARSMIKTSDQLNARVAELERELAACQMKIGGYKVAHDQAEQELAAETKNKQQFERDWLECCDELAAAQAREKVLRDALERLACLGNGDKHGNSIGNEIAIDALAQPTDDTALKAVLAAERTRCLAEVYDDGKRNPIDSARERIRALGKSTDYIAPKAVMEAEREKFQLHDAADVATKAMRKAWQLGQTYWQQADSESCRQNAKSVITQDTFNNLLDSTADAIRAIGD